MTKPAACLGDTHSCPSLTPIPHEKGTIESGSSNVTIADKPAARVNDQIKCEDGSTGIIKESNACVLINGQRAARIDDKTDHDGTIDSGQSTILIADGEPFIEFGDEGQIEIGENVFFGD